LVVSLEAAATVVGDYGGGGNVLVVDLEAAAAVVGDYGGSGNVLVIGLEVTVAVEEVYGGGLGRRFVAAAVAEQAATTAAIFGVSIGSD
jgi:hypothetical protein